LPCALVLRVRMALGHLGDLGHRFKLQAGASGWLALGHLGHCFLRDPNDLKAGAGAF
jgi:hypothetical protein